MPKYRLLASGGWTRAEYDEEKDRTRFFTHVRGDIIELDEEIGEKLTRARGDGFKINAPLVRADSDDDPFKDQDDEEDEVTRNRARSGPIGDARARAAKPNPENAESTQPAAGTSVRRG
jgi:hypothetical protein